MRKENDFQIRPIAHIKSPFMTKFGVPRQSGITQSIISEIIFEPEYRDISAIRGLEDFSHIWLIWLFSESVSDTWSPTVRPPKLGGNKRMGVFATRSPFRPNHLGLSCVKIEKIRLCCENGPVISVSGADLIDGTPIFDIKPYIAYSDSKPDALCGFAMNPERNKLQVKFRDCVLDLLPQELLAGLLEALEQDPRPAYQDDASRIYKMSYSGFDIGFTVHDGCAVVESAEPIK
ncbi:MAG: tRNA (N6-threonylcarbamoyladenosine(37)-N6)-methyltransferase TrmO [Acutalibacteraceae bacterium]